MKMRFLVLLTLGLGVTLFPRSAFAETATLTYAGSSCHAYPFANGGPGRSLSTGVLSNATNASIEVICPFPKRAGSSISSASALVIDQNASAAVSCTLYGSGLDGVPDYNETETSSGSSSTPQTLSFDGIAAAPFVYARCTIPAAVGAAKSGIVGFNITESFDPEEGGDGDGDGDGGGSNNPYICEPYSGDPLSCDWVGSGPCRNDDYCTGLGYCEEDWFPPYDEVCREIGQHPSCAPYAYAIYSATCFPDCYDDRQCALGATCTMGICAF